MNPEREPEPAIPVDPGVRAAGSAQMTVPCTEPWEEETVLRLGPSLLYLMCGAST